MNAIVWAEPYDRPMHPALAHACDALGIELPAIRHAADFSLDERDVARDFFVQRLGCDLPLDVVVCGSMARHEMSTSSDFDYLVVAHGLVADPSAMRMFRGACLEWCDQHGIKKPGSTGLFGTVVSGAELVERIGLEFDTNASLTRRILLLEEGVSVLRPELHRRFVSAILGRYLDEDQSDTSGPPRFLLNDVVRYWRTIAVDYQAKVWRDLSTGWGLRYLKLRSSRKLTFVSALVSLFLIELRTPSDAKAFLTEQFVDLPALARIAQLVDVLDGDHRALDELREILKIADCFCGFFDDADRRAAMEGVSAPARSATNPEFQAMRSTSMALQGHLERLFFDTSAIRDMSRKYLAF